jgi:hypothetical protein
MEAKRIAYDTLIAYFSKLSAFLFKFAYKGVTLFFALLYPAASFVTNMQTSALPEPWTIIESASKNGS